MKNTLSYKVDNQATIAYAANERGYHIGDITMDNTYRYRKFLGITTQGYFLVQEFYTQTNSKYSDPYIMLTASMLTTRIDGFVPIISGRLGPYTVYYDNGQAEFKVTYDEDGAQGLFQRWYENGQKQLQGYLENDNQIGIWYSWDPEGYLSETIDYDEERKILNEALHSN